MKAFSVSPEGGHPKESGGDKGETRKEFLDSRRCGGAEFLSATADADKESFGEALGSSETCSGESTSSTCKAFCGPPQISDAGAKRCMEPSIAVTTTPSGIPVDHLIWGGSAEEISQDHDASSTNEVAAATESFLVKSEILGEGEAEGRGDDDVGAADWLDVTHALLNRA